MPNETNQMVATEKDQKGHRPVKFQIQIDRVHYTVTQEFMTGAELRRVPPTPIPADRDLFEVVPGAPDSRRFSRRVELYYPSTPRLNVLFIL